MKKRLTPKVEAMKQRSLIIENERQSLHTPKFYLSEQVVTDHDKTYDYKKEGDKYFFRRKGDSEWEQTNNSAVKGVFGDNKSIAQSDNKTLSKTVSNAPFKNTEEGNKFRSWVNDTHPDYAKSIKLDRKGSHNNSYIAKAWGKYGKEYQKHQSMDKIKTTDPMDFYKDSLTQQSDTYSQYDKILQQKGIDPEESMKIVAQKIVKNKNVTNPDASLTFDGDTLKWVSGGSVIKEWGAESGLTILNTPLKDYKELLNRYVKTPQEWSKNKNAGPLPAGTWSVGPIQERKGSKEEINTMVAILKQFSTDQSIDFGADSELSKLSWGNYRAYINPVSYKGPRGSFYIHGGSLPGSHGCIDLTDEMEDFAKFYLTWSAVNKKTSIPLKVDYGDKNKFIATLWNKMSDLVS